MLEMFLSSPVQNSGLDRNIFLENEECGDKAVNSPC